jgi:hypothetical protein
MILIQIIASIFAVASTILFAQKDLWKGKTNNKFKLKFSYGFGGTIFIILSVILSIIYMCMPNYENIQIVNKLNTMNYKYDSLIKKNVELFSDLKKHIDGKLKELNISDTVTKTQTLPQIILTKIKVSDSVIIGRLTNNSNTMFYDSVTVSIVKGANFEYDFTKNGGLFNLPIKNRSLNEIKIFIEDLKGRFKSKVFNVKDINKKLDIIVN